MASTGVHICLPLVSLRRHRGQDVVMTCEDRAWTGQQWVDRIAGLSHGLTSAHSITKGDVVMVAAQNSDRMLEALLAACDAGAIVSPTNTRWSATELAAAVQLMQPKVLIADEQSWGLATQALQDVVVQLQGQGEAQQQAVAYAKPQLILLGDTARGRSVPGSASPQWCTEDLIQQHHRPQQGQRGPAAGAARCQQPQPGAPLQLRSPPCGSALVCFTSGTTGRSKGVVLSHAAFHAQSLAKLAVVGYCAQDTYLHLAPLFHIGGLSSGLACLMAGSAHVVAPRFSAPSALALMRAHTATAFIAVPAMLSDLAAAWSQGQAGPRPPEPLTHVTRILLGAGAVSPQLQAAAAAMFPNAAIHSAYGMTEACSSITFKLLRPAPSSSSLSASGAVSAESGSGSSSRHAPSVQGTEYAGAVCVGQPAPGIALHIQPLPSETSCSSDGSSSCSGQVGQLVEGEVWTRGPHTMSHYWRDPGETSKVLAPGTWLRTGDVGFLDPRGALWLRGREKDMVKSGGENVFAAEVERVLCSHPLVAAAAVVGLPDARLGERVSALVVLKHQARAPAPAAPPAHASQAPSSTRAAQPASNVNSGAAQTGGAHSQASVCWVGPVAHAAWLESGPAQPAAGGTSAQGAGLQAGAQQGYDASPQGEGRQGAAVVELSPEALQAFCRGPGGLSAYKLPRFIAALAGPLPGSGLTAALAWGQPAPGNAAAAPADAGPDAPRPAAPRGISGPASAGPSQLAVQPGLALPLNASGKVVKAEVRTALLSAQQAWERQQKAGIAGSGLRSKL